MREVDGNQLDLGGEGVEILREIVNQLEWLETSVNLLQQGNLTISNTFHQLEIKQSQVKPSFIGVNSSKEEMERLLRKVLMLDNEENKKSLSAALISNNEEEIETLLLEWKSLQRGIVGEIHVLLGEEEVILMRLEGLKLLKRMNSTSAITLKESSDLQQDMTKWINYSPPTPLEGYLDDLVRVIEEKMDYLIQEITQGVDLINRTRALILDPQTGVLFGIGEFPQPAPSLQDTTELKNRLNNQRVVDYELLHSLGELEERGKGEDLLFRGINVFIDPSSKESAIVTINEIHTILHSNVTNQDSRDWIDRIRRVFLANILISDLLEIWGIANDGDLAQFTNFMETAFTEQSSQYQISLLTDGLEKDVPEIVELLHSIVLECDELGELINHPIIPAWNEEVLKTFNNQVKEVMIPSFLSFYASFQLMALSILPHKFSLSQAILFLDSINDKTLNGVSKLRAVVEEESGKRERMRQTLCNSLQKIVQPIHDIKFYTPQELVTKYQDLVKVYTENGDEIGGSHFLLEEEETLVTECQNLSEALEQLIVICSIPCPSVDYASYQSNDLDIHDICSTIKSIHLSYESVEIPQISFIDQLTKLSQELGSLVEQRDLKLREYLCSMDENKGVGQFFEFEEMYQTLVDLIGGKNQNREFQEQYELTINFSILSSPIMERGTSLVESLFNWKGLFDEIFILSREEASIKSGGRVTRRITSGGRVGTAYSVWGILSNDFNTITSLSDSIQKIITLSLKQEDMMEEEVKEDDEIDSSLSDHDLFATIIQKTYQYEGLSWLDSLVTNLIKLMSNKNVLANFSNLKSTKEEFVSLFSVKPPPKVLDWGLLEVGLDGAVLKDGRWRIRNQEELGGWKQGLAIITSQIHTLFEFYQGYQDFLDVVDQYTDKEVVRGSQFLLKDGKGLLGLKAEEDFSDEIKEQNLVFKDLISRIKKLSRVEAIQPVILNSNNNNSKTTKSKKKKKSGKGNKKLKKKSPTVFKDEFMLEEEDLFNNYKEEEEDESFSDASSEEEEEEDEDYVDKNPNESSNKKRKRAPNIKSVRGDDNLKKKKKVKKVVLKKVVRKKTEKEVAPAPKVYLNDGLSYRYYHICLFI